MNSKLKRIITEHPRPNTGRLFARRDAVHLLLFLPPGQPAAPPPPAEASVLAAAELLLAGPTAAVDLVVVAVRPPRGSMEVESAELTQNSEVDPKIYKLTQQFD